MSPRVLLTLAMVALAAQTPRAQQPPPQTFRGAVDLIAVDVQIVDRDGQPVAGLGPDKFEVTINGRKRRVVSADLISASGTVAPSAVVTGGTTPAGAAAPTVAPLGRVVILAVDCTSFNVAVTRGAMVAAKTFIEHLPDNDMVGLFAYPMGPKIDPTIDHAAIVRALDAIVGQRDAGVEGEFHLRPGEIVDLTAWADNLPGYGEDLALSICGRDVADEGVQQCRGRLRIAVKSVALVYEGQGYASLGMLRSLMHGLASVSGRKTVVLLSGGTVASDIPGGRPDLAALGVEVGRAAAEANAAIYTLFIDQGWAEQYAAETRRPNVTINPARDSEVLGKWLEMFSGTAGGVFAKVLVGNGEYAYERLIREMSAYYLLGVEPAETDRDGRTHEIRVKVAQRGVTIHNRSWVMVPKRNATPVPALQNATAATPVSAPPPRPLPASVRPLTDAFERADYAGVQRLLLASTDLANLIADFRASDNPWPAAPRRTAAFALDLAFAGLSNRNGFARDQGMKLLAEYVALVRQPAAADPFECTWYWAAVAGLEGLLLPDSGLVLVGRALERCPAEPRFALASAVIADQEWSQGAGASTSLASGSPIDTPQSQKVQALYEAALKFPEIAAEVRVRASWFAYRTGDPRRALDLIGEGSSLSLDPQIRYAHELVKGQALRGQGKADAAMAALRGALLVWPGAQSARVALMTLTLGSGNRQEAEQLADSVQIAPDTQIDPWWTFGRGDYRVYPAILATLRSLGR